MALTGENRKGLGDNAQVSLCARKKRRKCTHFYHPSYLTEQPYERPPVVVDTKVSNCHSSVKDHPDDPSRAYLGII